jgi:hypothetical protein
MKVKFDQSSQKDESMHQLAHFWSGFEIVTGGNADDGFVLMETVGST